MNTLELKYDLVIAGGGTAGPMIAIKTEERSPALHMLLIDRVHVKRGGTISMDMDGLNNAVIPGHATPEQYTREVTLVNDGIVDQSGVCVYAQHSFTTIEQLDRWGVRFEKDETGDYTIKKAHHIGSCVLPMPGGHDIKKMLYRQLKRARVEITNHTVVTRVLTDIDDAAYGVLGLDCCTTDFLVVCTKTAVLSYSAVRRLGLPAPGYLMDIYENPTNAGNNYTMTYHTGAELSNPECFWINPPIKDYSDPAYAYMTDPLGGYTAGTHGECFIQCNYWSDQIMWEFYQELQGGKGPVFLKLGRLTEETIQTIEAILHANERPSRDRFHAERGIDYHAQIVEIRISKIGFCSGHSTSGVYVNARAETTMLSLYATGDMAAVPHNYMLGVFAYGWFVRQNAADHIAGRQDDARIGDVQIERERVRVFAPLQRNHGLPPAQVEYKLRHMVNDYLQSPKVTRKMEIGPRRFDEIAEDVTHLHAHNPHELMRAVRVNFIHDCTEMAVHASLFRTESRWGLYHHRVNYPGRSNANWFCHTRLYKDAHSAMASHKQAIEPYVIPIDVLDTDSYTYMRIPKTA